jgi:prevent-host-death family protein
MADMKYVGAREANQKFSKLLAEAESGEVVTVTRRGKPVVEIVAVSDRRDPDRERALRRLRESFKKRSPLGGRGFTRDEMHER